MKLSKTLSALFIAVSASSAAFAMEASQVRPNELPWNISHEKTLNQQIQSGALSTKYVSTEDSMVERHKVLCGAFDQPATGKDNPLKVEIPNDKVSRVNLEINYATVTVVCKQRSAMAVKQGVAKVVDNHSAVSFVTPDGKEVRKCVNSCNGTQPQ